MVKFAAKPVCNCDTADVGIQIKFEDVRAFLDGLGGGVDIFRSTTASIPGPGGYGLIPFFVIEFISQHHERPVGQSEAKINPCPADIQMQIFAKAYRLFRRGLGGKKSTRSEERRVGK